MSVLSEGTKYKAWLKCIETMVFNYKVLYKIVPIELSQTTSSPWSDQSGPKLLVTGWVNENKSKGALVS